MNLLDVKIIETKFLNESRGQYRKKRKQRKTDSNETIVTRVEMCVGPNPVSCFQTEILIRNITLFLMKVMPGL